MARITEYYDEHGKLVATGKKKHGFVRFIMLMLAVCFVLGLFSEIVHAL